MMCKLGSGVQDSSDRAPPHRRAVTPPSSASLVFLNRVITVVTHTYRQRQEQVLQEMQDSSPEAGPTCRRAALTVGQWTPSLSQQDRPLAYRAALLLMRSPDFVVRMAGVNLLSVSLSPLLPRVWVNFDTCCSPMMPGIVYVSIQVYGVGELKNAGVDPLRTPAISSSLTPYT